MIAQLKGLCEALGDDQALVDVQGVGYQVFCSSRTLRTLTIGQACRLAILTHVRDDHIHLYGFANGQERAWFDLLVSVQGVGPRMALAILGHLSPDEMANALMLEDKRSFQAVSGVGPKLATRLVTELRQKSPAMTVPSVSRDSADLAAPPFASTSSSGLSGTAALVRDLTSALTNLGYDEGSARSATMQVTQGAAEDADVAALIPAALKALSPGS